MRIRILGLLAALALVPMAAPPASAASVEVLNGIVTTSCHGCGTWEATAVFTVAGKGTAFADLVITSPTGSTCNVSGSAVGTISGALEGDIAWSHIGGGLTIRITTYNTAYQGTGVLAPVTLGCGVPGSLSLTATIAGL